MDGIDRPRTPTSLCFLGPFALSRDSHSWTVLISSLSFASSTFHLPPLLSARMSEKPSGTSVWAAEIQGLLDYYGFPKPLPFPLYMSNLG